jgi:predicted PurR-regulated permease PerM
MRDANGDGKQPDASLARVAQALDRISTLLRAVAITAAAVLLITTLGEVVMIVFAAVLVAVLLRGVAVRTGRLTGIGTGWGLLVVVVLLAGLFGVLGWQFGPDLADQATQLQKAAAQEFTTLRTQMQQTDWGQSLLERLPFGLGDTGSAGPTNSGAGLGSVLPRLAGIVAGALWSVVGVVATVIIVLMAALYMAAAPAQYLHGFTHVLPTKQRSEARRVMDRIGRDLWGWLIGQLIDMLIVGVLCGVGLLLLGVPLAFILGVIAALTNFVPFIGAIAGAVPAVLIALSLGWQKAFYVTLLYVAVQIFEGNVTAPLIQRRAIDLPPALTLVAQTVFGLIFGIFGIILATPLTAAILAAVQQLTEDDPEYR